MLKVQTKAITSLSTRATTVVPDAPQRTTDSLPLLSDAAERSGLDVGQARAEDKLELVRAKGAFPETLVIKTCRRSAKAGV